MKIGINLDGVLIDKSIFQYKYGLKYFGKNLSYVNEYAYSFRDMFNCIKDEEIDLWNKYYIKYYLLNIWLKHNNVPYDNTIY